MCPTQRCDPATGSDPLEEFGGAVGCDDVAVSITLSVETQQQPAAPAS
jgi:hypothetical protein